MRKSYETGGGFTGNRDWVNGKYAARQKLYGKKPCGKREQNSQNRRTL